MKKLQLLFTACALLCGSTAVQAEDTDVTSDYITNADFSSLDSWTKVSSGGFFDGGIGLIGTYMVRNDVNGHVDVSTLVDDTHLATEYCMGSESRWASNFLSYTQDVTLPAGSYRLDFDVCNANGATSNNVAYKTLCFVGLGDDTKYEDTNMDWAAGQTPWTTHSIAFSLTEEQEVTISLGYSQGEGDANNIGHQITPILYFSHLKLFSVDDVKPLDSSWITVIPSISYEGEAVEPELVVVDDQGYELVEGTDFTAEYENNTDTGIATVTLTGIGNYSGTASATFSITPAEITSRMIEYLYWEFYNGKEYRPVLRIIYNDVQLIEGRDYAVAYKNNKDATTATCVITGLGNFTGKCIKNFAIRRITLDKVTVASVDATTEKLTYGGMTLVKGKDYTVTRKDGIAYFSGEGNYFGDLEVKFGSADSGSDETATAPGDDATAINGVESAAAAEEWYTVDGVKLAAKPSKPGIYVVNGAKVVLK
jgi:hypothetical protein